MSDLLARTRQTPSELADRYRAEGHWNDDTLGAFVARQAAKHARSAVRVWSADRSFRGTVSEVFEQSLRFANGLRARGIGPGDIVAYQLPNWAETLTTLWGGALAGVVLVPIVHFYGPNEIRFILRESGAKAMVTVNAWGGVEQFANLQEVRSEVPALELVAVLAAADSKSLRGDTVAFSTLLESDPVEQPRAVHPDDPVIVAYTSGTTAQPKGVIHSHRSLLAEMRQATGEAFERTNPLLNSAPLAHMSGMLGGALGPFQRGEEIHLIDRWDPGRVLDIMDTAQVRPGGGPPIYITSLLDHPRFSDAHRDLIPIFGMGGAPIPVSVAQRAEAAGIRPWPIYGSTEHPTITQASPEDLPNVRIHTNGTPRPGVEIRLLDRDGNDVAPGDTGEVLSRGPDLFCGYTDPALTEVAVDRDGWYHTGDIGSVDADGNLSISDRLGDLIIRGGRNISGTEIESHVLAHPAVAEVAVVAAPHATLGETACAVLRLQPGAATVSIEDIQQRLAVEGVPKQKWPESIRVVNDFPRTPTGKIRKHLLRSAHESGS